ncbi:hypothetical protein P167DRAFT_45325 [Morchella conica CCBAS932]|uniref:Uncharacterized protein n=1 Tax=Morchella conica CCBAS932 TaxID=1392247 RepID=A0A3N4KZA9_9PEZI|nr:hypothetical protein P167DRAFT_45325 [Morchella conica CCBAS932]
MIMTSPDSVSPRKKGNTAGALKTKGLGLLSPLQQPRSTNSTVYFTSIHYVLLLQHSIPLAMAQPNFQNLSAAFATASNEIALLPNLPVVNLAEQIQQIHQMLQEMQQGLQNLQQGQQQIRQDILRSDRNNFARLINSSVTRADTPLEPLYDLGGQLIQNFPQTSEEIKTLNGAMIDTLLNSLTLPTNGAVDTRRKRLMKHIGLITV